MRDPIIDRPVAGLQAFRRGDRVAAWSRAAQMIGIGVYLSGNQDVVAEMESEAPELLVPYVEPLGEQRISISDVGGLYGEVLDRHRASYVGYDPGGFLGNLWLDVLRERDAASALRLLYAGLSSQDEIVRVAAAAAIAPFLSDVGPIVESVLVDGCMAESATVLNLAAQTLAKIAPEHPVLELLVGRGENGDAEPSRTSIVIHGTFARLRSDWYRPGGRFHSFLKSDVSSDLYSGTDYFRWDGRYSEASRKEAATDLRTWMSKHGVRRLDTVYAHSHGGTVALDALAAGARMRLLVLMSVPATTRPDQEWDFIFKRAGRLVSIRSRMDLVIYADRSPQRFRHEIRQLLPPGIWFAHGAVLQPRVWRKHRLPQEIAYERGMAR